MSRKQAAANKISVIATTIVCCSEQHSSEQDGIFTFKES